MTSKQAMNKIQHHINGTKLNGKEILECYKIIFKDLEILEEIRNTVKVIDYGEECQNQYVLKVGNDIYHLWLKEDYNRWVRWLENDK